MNCSLSTHWGQDISVVMGKQIETGYDLGQYQLN